MAFKPALRSSMRLKPAAVLAVLMAIQTCLTAQVSSPLLHGLVVLEDGSPPPKGLTVMSTCGNLSTWRDGTFTFTSGYKAGPGWVSRRCGWSSAESGPRARSPCPSILECSRVRAAWGMRTGKARRPWDCGIGPLPRNG